MGKYLLPRGEIFSAPQINTLGESGVSLPEQPALMEFPLQIEAFKTRSDIDSSKYVLVQDGGLVVAVSSCPRYFGNDGKNFLDANTSVLREGLIVTPPRRFLRNWMDINSALKGEIVRYNASGKLIDSEQVVRNAEVMDRAWAYVNARFSRGEGFKGLDIVTLTGIRDGNLTFTRQPLMPCLEEECLADAESVNEQGMLTRRAKTNKYEPGKTITFCPPALRKDKPEHESVAGFSADSSGARFSCDWSDAGRYAWLGVFTSAEGETEK